MPSSALTVRIGVEVGPVAQSAEADVFDEVGDTVCAGESFELASDCLGGFSIGRGAQQGMDGVTHSLAVEL